MTLYGYGHWGSGQFRPHRRIQAGKADVSQASDSFRDKIYSGIAGVEPPLGSASTDIQTFKSGKGFDIFKY